MVAWLDVCRYTPTAGGTTDWTYSAAVIGYQSPTAAGVVNGAIYRYRAESTDLSQWEVGYGAYNTATGVLARTTVLFNSSATGTGAGQSGAGSKINFTVAPQVAVVALAEDLVILGSGTFNQFEYTATAGQTTFSGIDINGATLAYAVGFLEVFLNGVKLNKADFTATSTTSVVLAATALNDQVTLLAFTTATVANTLAPSNNLSDVSNVTTSRQNLGVAPYDAEAFNGIQINGNMEVSQENGASAVTLVSTNVKYVCDQWTCQYVHTAATAVFTAQQVAAGGGPYGTGAYLELKATTLSAMAAAGDFAFIFQRIEGYRCGRLGFGVANAQSITIGFWVFATITGTGTVSVRNAAGTRSYVADFTISAANTFEYKTITVPGDTTGTWLVTTGIGMEVGFCFGGGSTYNGTNNSWGAINAIKTASTTNFFATNNNRVVMTGVTVTPGTDAPSSAKAPLLQRPYAEELRLCERYLQRYLADGATIDGLVGQCTSTTNALVPWPLRTRMRIAPTFTSSVASGFQLRSSSGSGVSLTSLSLNAADQNLIGLSAVVASGIVAGNATCLLGFGTCFMQADARL